MAAKEDAVPLAPENLLRAYANIAHGYHQAIPLLREDVDRVEGIALASHGIASEALKELKVLRIRQEEIAVAVKAKRTNSGTLRISLPPPTPPLNLREHIDRSPTGHHFTVDIEKFAALEQKVRDREISDRAKAEKIMEIQTEQIAAEAANDAWRKKWTFRAFIAFGVIGIVGGACGWALGHVSIQPAPQTTPAH